MTQEQIEQLKTTLANKQYSIIKQLELGFINNDCFIPSFAILIHCAENMSIFNETQRDNIIQFINNISYV